MSEDREQEPTGDRESTARPVTAAARRERRASARPAARKDGGGGAESGSGSTESTGSGPSKKGRPTPVRDRQEKKGSPFVRLFRFLREVVAELRKVIWPTRKQLLTYTAVVLVFVSFMVALVAGLDFVFHKGVFWLFG